MVATSAQNPDFVSLKDGGLEICRDKLFTLILQIINLSEIYTKFGIAKDISENILMKVIFPRHADVPLLELPLFCIWRALELETD